MKFRKNSIGLWTKSFFDKRKEHRKLIGKNPEDIFIELIKKNLNKNKKLLDIGTGLGRTPLRLASHAKEVWGIDPAAKLIAVAKRNSKKQGKNNVYFKVADGRHLPFENETFDLAISQRGPATDNLTFAREAFRVLERSGKLIEITIGEKDKENIKRIFGRGQSYCDLIKKIKASKEKIKLLKKVGFKKVSVSEYDLPEYFVAKRDLVLRLSGTPIIPNFNLAKDLKLVNKVAEKYKTKFGIKTNLHRLIIVAEK